MNDRIFLHKYRVSIAEADPAGESENNFSAHPGFETELGRRVVVETHSAVSLTTAAREQLQAEAAAARRLNHPNIPALYDFGIEDDHFVYVTEHFDGTVAEKWVRSYGPMPVSPVLSIASQVVSALSAAAFHRIVHQSINPGNLLLMAGQTAEGDWPLVKVLHFAGGVPNRSGNGRPSTDSGQLNPYASPEQIQNGTIDFRSAMYSLGATMWFLLTGAPPPMTRKEQLSKPGPSVEMLNGVPKSVRELLSQMLSANPERRPGDPLAFSRLLQDCLTHLQGPEPITRATTIADPSTKRITNDEPESQWNRKRVLVVAAVPLVIATFALLAMLGYFRPRQIVPAQKRIDARGPAVAATSSTPATNAASAASNQSLPAKSTASENANAPQVESDFVQRAAVNMVLPSAWPKTLSLFRTPRPPEAPNAVPATLGAFPETTNLLKVTSVAQVEVPTTARLPQRKPDDGSAKKVAGRRPDSALPEVRRAEPPAPAEGPPDPSKRTKVQPKPTPPTRDDARSNAR